MHLATIQITLTFCIFIETLKGEVCNFPTSTHIHIQTYIYCDAILTH